MPGPGKIMLLWVGRTLIAVDDLDQVDAVALGEQAPLVEEREDGGAVGVLDDLCRLRFDRAVHHGQRELVRVEDLAEELSTRASRLVVAAGADAPEVADGGDVVAAGHYALETVCQQRGSIRCLSRRMPCFMIGQATNSVVPGATVVSISVRHSGRDLLADRSHGGLQGGHLGLAGAQVAQFVLRVVALHVDDHAVGQLQAVAVVGGHQASSFSLHAPIDHGVDFGVFGLDRRLAAIQQRDLPVASRARAAGSR